MRTIWRLVGLAIVELALLIGALAAWTTTRPYTTEEVIALAAGRPDWRVTVDYRPSEPLVRVTLRMDDLSRYQSVQYRVESTETWLSLWGGEITGHLSEILTLDGSWRDSPGPMDATQAGRVARSIKVYLREDGKDAVVDFGDAGFATPVTWLDSTFLNPPPIRLVRPGDQRR